MLADSRFVVVATMQLYACDITRRILQHVDKYARLNATLFVASFECHILPFNHFINAMRDCSIWVSNAPILLRIAHTDSADCLI